MNYRRKINYYETDGMQVVHHSNYIRFLEEARCVMLDELGIPYSDIEKRGLMIPVLEVNCKYKVPAKFDDILEIQVNVRDFNGLRLIVDYNVINVETKQLCLKATTKHCFTNSSLKPVSVKKSHPDIYEKLVSSITESINS